MVAVRLKRIRVRLKRISRYHRRAGSASEIRWSSLRAATGRTGWTDRVVPIVSLEARDFHCGLSTKFTSVSL